MLPLTAGYFRYTDDTIAFGGAGVSSTELLRVVDDVLGSLALSRSVPKTEVCDDPEKALEVIERWLLNYLELLLDVLPATGIERVREAFDDEVANSIDPDQPVYRWFVRTFTNRVDPYAVRTTVDREALFDTDPKVSADYVAKCGLQTQAVVDGLMNRQDPSDGAQTAATRLHVLRVLTGRRWGRDEWQLFNKIAEDETEFAAVRGWAWKASASTTSYKPRRAMEAALDHPDDWVRRGAQLSLKGKLPTRARTFLSTLEVKHPDSWATAAWLAA